ncbi:MAG: hypothetical protein R3E32_27410 [Chitinophagales bacterium]
MKNLKVIVAVFSFLMFSPIFAQFNNSHDFNIEDLNNRNLRPIIQLPDLVVVDISFQFDIFAEGGDFGRVIYKVKNIGNAPALSAEDDPEGEGYFINLFLSTDVVSPNGEAIFRNNRCVEDALLQGGRTSGKTIQPGQTVVFVDDNLTVPIGCQVCENNRVARQFGINIDPNNTLRELNDNNNDAFRTVMIKCKGVK